MSLIAASSCQSKLSVKVAGGKDAATATTTSPTSPIPNLETDSVPPTAAGDAVTFFVNSVDQSLADLTWSAAGTDSGSGVAKQQIRLFGKNNLNCSGTPDQTIDVSATATNYHWERFSTPAVAGTVRFTVRTIDNAGFYADSNCSIVSIENGVVTFYGPSAGFNLGNAPQYVDVTGDGIVDMIFYDTSFNSNRGYIAVLEGSDKPWTKSLKIYDGEYDGDYLGSYLQFEDVTGDGIKDIISVRADASPGGLASAGSMFIVPGGTSLPASGAISVVARRYDGDVAGMKFGEIYACEDVTGEGTKDIVIGSTTATLNTFANAGYIGVIKGAVTLPASGSLLTAGRRYDGDAANHKVGAYPRFADLNGDGINEIISANPGSDVGGTNSGMIVVILGAANLPASGFVAASARRYDGVAASDRLSVSYIEDVDGDGKPDLVGSASGAAGGGTSRGSIYVLLGATSLPASGTIAVSGLRFNGVNNSDGLGSALMLTDITGDGYPELISNSYVASPGGRSLAGSVYVIPGGSSFPASSGTIAAVGRRYDGATASDSLGFQKQTCDLNGDGIKDLIAEALDEGSGNGAVYVFLGGALAANGNASTVASRRYTGGSGDRVGWGSISCEDINNDNFLDLIAVSSQASSNGVSNSGNLSIILSASTMPASGTFAAMGRRYTGSAAKQYFGNDPVFVDVTGDGHPDIISSTFLTNNGAMTNVGGVFVIPGGATLPANGTVAAVGRYYIGESASMMLNYRLKVTDVTGDGVADLLMRPSACDPSADFSYYGCFFVIPGSSSLPASGTISSSIARRYDGTADFPITSGYVSVLDLDHDGKSEVVIPNQSQSVGGLTNVGALFSMGGAVALPASGTFASQGTMVVSGTSDGQQFAGSFSFDPVSYEMMPEDLNGDGLTDLLIGSTGTPSDFGYILGKTNLAAMSYTPVATSTGVLGSSIANNLKFIDVTGDGKKDLVSSSGAADFNSLTDNGAILIVPNAFMQFP